MSKPLDNPLLDQAANPSADPSREASVMEEGALPEIFRGRMFCTVHGRQCYRGTTFTGESVWICTDERLVIPLRGSQNPSGVSSSSHWVTVNENWLLLVVVKVTVYDCPTLNWKNNPGIPP